MFRIGGFIAAVLTQCFPCRVRSRVPSDLPNVHSSHFFVEHGCEGLGDQAVTQRKQASELASQLASWLFALSADYSGLGESAVLASETRPHNIWGDLERGGGRKRERRRERARYPDASRCGVGLRAGGP